MERVEALERKALAFGELLEISRGQDAVLERDDPEALLALLARKQGLLQRIEGIDREIGAAGAAAAEDPRVRDLLARIRGTLDTIVACEEETKRRVDGMKRETLQALTRIRQGRRAADLYRRTGQGTTAMDQEQ